MANTSSAKKATRKIAARTAVNKNRRSRVRTFLRRVEEALLSGDKTAAQEAFKAAQPECFAPCKPREGTRGLIGHHCLSIFKKRGLEPGFLCLHDTSRYDFRVAGANATTGFRRCA